jgi:uncharacterized protein (TIRG00374 family)
VIGNLIATSAGAFSYVAILRSKYKVKISSGINSLIIARVLDAFFLFLALFSSAQILRHEIIEIQILVYSLVIIFLTVFVGIGIFIIFKEKVIRFIDDILKVFNLDKLLMFRKVPTDLRNFMTTSLVSSKRILARIFCSSFLIFVIYILFLYSSLRAFGLNLNLWIVLFILAVTLIMNLIPLQIFGGLGIQEVTNLYLLGIFGYPESVIIPVLVGTRALFLVSNMVFLMHLVINSVLDSKIIVGVKQ